MATEKNREGWRRGGRRVRGKQHLGPETLGKWGACIHYGSNE